MRALVHDRPVPLASEQVYGDLTQEQTLRGAAQGVNGVVHTAGITHARRAGVYDAVNVGGTANLLRAVDKDAAVRFLHIEHQGDLRGGRCLQPLEASRGGGWCAKVRPSMLIVRLPELYGGGRQRGGRRDHCQIAAWCADTAGRAGGPISSARSMWDDAVAALAAALQSASAVGKTYTLAGECMSAQEVAERCRRALRLDQPGGEGARGVRRRGGRCWRGVAPLDLYPGPAARGYEHPSRRHLRKPSVTWPFIPRSLQEGLDQLAQAPGTGPESRRGGLR